LNLIKINLRDQLCQQVLFIARDGVKDIDNNAHVISRYMFYIWDDIVQYTSLWFNRTLRKHKQVSHRSKYTVTHGIGCWYSGSNTCVPWFAYSVSLYISCNILSMHIWTWSCLTLRVIIPFARILLRRMKRSSVGRFLQCNCCSASLWTEALC